MGDHLKKNDVKFPWQASVSESLDLEIVIDPEPMKQFPESFSIHPNVELANLLDKNLFDFAGGKHLEIVITPSVVRSDENLKALEPSDRSCYFEGERKLRLFKAYTRRNCQFECFSNYSLSMCNCVPFDFVRDFEARVCGFSDEDVNCDNNENTFFKDHRSTEKLASCSCLSPCDSITYNIEIRESKLRENE